MDFGQDVSDRCKCNIFAETAKYLAVVDWNAKNVYVNVQRFYDNS